MRIIPLNYIGIILLISIIIGCKKTTKIREEIMSENINLNGRLKNIFLKTKLVCFGRYALEVPAEAKLVIGTHAVEVIRIKSQDLQLKIREDLKKIFTEDRTAEITYNNEGPIKNSWQLRYYDSIHAKNMKFLFFQTYITKGDFTFIAGDAVNVDIGEREEEIAGRQLRLAKNIRLRDTEEVPSDPGICVEHGFLAENLYNEQEMDNVGIYFPSIPDITFSVSSNKDAYGDYPAEEFEKRWRGELSLLYRIQGAKDIQGESYPKRNLLREGKRTVQHWKGEESLIRRPDGVHDFEWALVGKPKNIANPSVLEAKLYSKVADNRVGAAEAASLTDDEAIALWDKLLSSLKFRVKVPGAPPGSYYIDPDKPAQ
jgi:hypothetical protein